MSKINQTGQLKTPENRRAVTRRSYQKHIQKRRAYGRKYSETRRRRLGIPPITETKDPKKLKAIEIENKVMVILAPLGVVSRTNGVGPDVTLTTAGGKTYTIEVKPIRKRTFCKSWIIDPVEPNRRFDDYIAYVYESGVVTIMAMQDHLRLCTSSGYRTATDLALHPPNQSDISVLVKVIKRTGDLV